MNKQKIWLIFLGALMVVSVALSLVPLPGYTVYGQARDRWGWPCVEGTEVICRINGVESTRAYVRYNTGPAINFMLRVPLDDGMEPRYDSVAARIGETMTISIKDEYGEFSIIETNLPPVGLPAQSSKIIVTAGTDSDHDGLPDEWEYWVIMASYYDNIYTVADVRPDDDFDGDGVSNMNEFLAGTFPDMSGDYFYVEELLPQQNGALGLRFLSVPGKTYSVNSTTNLADALYLRCEFSLDSECEVLQKYVIGDGYYMTLFVSPYESTVRCCYRLFAE